MDSLKITNKNILSYIEHTGEFGQYGYYCYNESSGIGCVFVIGNVRVIVKYNEHSNKSELSTISIHAEPLEDNKYNITPVVMKNKTIISLNKDNFTLDQWKNYSDLFKCRKSEYEQRQSMERNERLKLRYSNLLGYMKII